jgi:[protein-PII] uridylyltransferase
MTMTAFKRDLSDPKTLEDFCDIVQSPERLKLLTIMTTADIMAVGPDRWNSWKAGLLSELYHRARAVLSGAGSTVDDDGLVVVAQKKLRRLIGDHIPALHYLTDHAPPDFFLAFPAETIAGFVKSIAKYIDKENPTALKITPKPDEGFSEVLVFTPDRKGLFATLSGAMAAAGASIMEARIFTLGNGMALDVFQVQNTAGQAYDNAAFLQRSIKSALAGQMDFAGEIGQRQKNVPRRQMHFKVAANVTIDNNASTRHTLIEVNGKDRPGFLYDITAALSAEGLQITAAKVTTFGARAVDVFYVKDQFGLKVLHAAKLARIERSLKNVLEHWG